MLFCSVRFGVQFDPFGVEGAEEEFHFALGSVVVRHPQHCAAEFHEKLLHGRRRIESEKGGGEGVESSSFTGGLDSGEDSITSNIMMELAEGDEFERSNGGPSEALEVHSVRFVVGFVRRLDEMSGEQLLVRRAGVFVVEVRLHNKVFLCCAVLGLGEDVVDRHSLWANPAGRGGAAGVEEGSAGGAGDLPLRNV